MNEDVYYMPERVNIANSIAYMKYVSQFDYIFSKAFFTHQELIALSGNYKVVIDYFNHTYTISEKVGCSVSCQLIIVLNRWDKILYQYKNVFGNPFHYYFCHSNSSEYLMCGADLLQFTIFNITKNKAHTFADKCIIDKQECISEFWYISGMQYNRSNNLLFINGQDMMNCPTVTIADLTNPEIVPLHTKNLGSFLAKLDNDYAFCKAVNWNSNNSLTLEVGEENTQVVTLTENQLFGILEE
ncbi:hypothetical protein [Rhodocytophaga aerolata]